MPLNKSSRPPIPGVQSLMLQPKGMRVIDASIYEVLSSSFIAILLPNYMAAPSPTFPYL